MIHDTDTAKTDQPEGEPEPENTFSPADGSGDPDRDRPPGGPAKVTGDPREHSKSNN